MVAIEVFVRSVAKIPHTPNGDASWYAEDGPRAWVAVVDGLGSGPEAARASRAAVACLRERALASPRGSTSPCMEQLVKECDRALRGTRGAALGLAVLDAEGREGCYVGIGNVEMRLVGERCHRPLAVPGIVGAGLRTVRVQHFPYVPGDLVVLHSDGLSSRFDLDVGRDRSHSLEALGEALVRDHGHSHDDLTLLLLRHHEA